MFTEHFGTKVKWREKLWPHKWPTGGGGGGGFIVSGIGLHVNDI